MLEDFAQPGKASFVIGGQFGSEGKGAAAAYIASKCQFDIVTANNGSQSGHTSIHEGKKRVLFHLPTAPFIMKTAPVTYLNAGSIIDPVVLMKELEDNRDFDPHGSLMIHPRAAVITDACREAENRPDSAQTKISSTRKGVGEALARKVLRSGAIAKGHPFLNAFVEALDLNQSLLHGNQVLVEVPQGVGLSLNGPFYPHCTSRDCTVGQAASDAGIHLSFVGPTMLVLRTLPIRVGSLSPHHHSGDCYPDQHEISWESLGQQPEITTVTKRQRRIFSFSEQQAYEALAITRPTCVMITFCNYVSREQLEQITQSIMTSVGRLGLGRDFKLLFEYGPTTADIYGEMQ
jgi:adenylosuccinate synthase